jgi:predicted CXXCH cytochrome family protein
MVDSAGRIFVEGGVGPLFLFSGFILLRMRLGNLVHRSFGGGGRLVLAAALVWLTVTALSAAVRQTSPIASTQAPISSQASISSPASPDGAMRAPADYLGSKSCEPCHEAQYAQWQRSLHIKMTKPLADATIVGDFRPGVKFADHGRSYEFGRSADGRPFMRVSFGGGAPETYDIDYTLGAKRYQGYLATLPDGRIYVLPAFWHVESRRWVDWKEITPIPDDAHDLRQIWNANCFNCHATNLAPGFDVPSKTYKTTWTEMGIGCEACHGTGRTHIALMKEWDANPSARPSYDRSANNRDLGTVLKIFSPRTAAPRQVYDTCSYCHGNKSNVYMGFRAGDRYEDYALPFFISAPIPETDFQGEFWPDGRPNRFNRPQALTLSGCFKAGAIACTNCHVAHGSRNDFSLKVNITQGRTGDLVCTQCHTGPTAPASVAAVREPLLVGSRAPTGQTAATPPWNDAELERHTFHKASSAGSRCISCHMSDVNWRLLIRRRDHTFQPPVPEMTVAVGVPNACTTCHDERTPEWAAKQMDAWWGDGERRKAAVSLADTMYRAGSHDRSVIPTLARLAVDRTNGALVRASAADFIRQLAAGGAGESTAQSQTSFGKGRPNASQTVPEVPAAPLPIETVNALVGAAADPEPMVRAAAVRALAAAGRRDVVVAAVLARLVDQARVVRAYAADVLLSFGIATLPGRAGEALARAQDDLATSLGMFTDSAAQHTELGWLEAERGHATTAREALDAAIHLEPTYARPVVIKGVLAARENRFGEALELWKKARSLEPSYPNIDKLIEEAERRK